MQTLTIGRNTDNNIVINDPSVSRNHAQLSKQSNTYFIKDLGSSNGTFINGKRVNGICELNKNDILKLGNTVVPWMKYVDYDNNAHYSHKTRDFEVKQKLPRQTESSSVHQKSFTSPQKKATSNFKWGRFLFVAILIGVVGIFLLSRTKDSNPISFSSGPNPSIENTHEEVLNGLDRTFIVTTTITNNGDAGNITVDAEVTQDELILNDSKTLYFNSGETRDVKFTFDEITRFRNDPVSRINAYASN